MSDDQPTADDAQARIAKALSLLDTWLHDESPHDDLRQQAMWRNVREVRAALAVCAHPQPYRYPLASGGTSWVCEDCDRSMIVHTELTEDEARRELGST